MSKATDDFKIYLNSIYHDVDPEIHNELWNKLIAVISEQQPPYIGVKLEDTSMFNENYPIINCNKKL
ncbi:MAG: hypothetical protein WAT79_08645 [Saprospiraceae bacterium]